MWTDKSPPSEGGLFRNEYSPPSEGLLRNEHPSPLEGGQISSNINNTPHYGINNPESFGLVGFSVYECAGSSADTRNEEESWIHICGRKYGIDIDHCFVDDCGKKATDGGHMVWPYNGYEYLCMIPVCGSHNEKKHNLGKGEPLRLKDGLPILIIPWY